MANDGGTTSGNDSTLFDAVFAAELAEIARRRQVHDPAAPTDPATVRESLVGLAFSGGGIRSATVCLGVLQALKSLKLLPMFDYLSTVSGGGFVGGWWSAYLSRTPTTPPQQQQPPPPPPPPHETLFPPDEIMEPARSPEYAKGKSDSAVSAGSDPIHHLRLFANYLTPRKGALSADTWWTATIISRNLLLTWVILLPLLFAAILAGRFYYLAQPNADVTTDVWPRSLPVNTEMAKERRAVNTELRRLREVQGADPARLELLRAQRRSMYLAEVGTRAKFAATVPASLLTLCGVCIFIWLSLLPFGRSTAEVVAAVCGFIAAAIILAIIVTIATRPDTAVNPAIAAATTAATTAVSAATAPATTSAAITIAPTTAPAAAQRGLGGSWWAWYLAWLVLGAVLLWLFNRNAIRAFRQAKGAWQAEVARNAIVHIHSTALRWTFLAGAVLLVSGFGHDIVDQLLFRGNAWLRTFGWTGVLTSIGGLIFTWTKASPSGGGDARERAQPNLVTRAIIALTPPLVLVTLALTAAWLVHRLMEHLVALPYQAPVARGFLLVNVVCAALFFGFAIMERRVGRRLRYQLLLSAAITMVVLSLLARNLGYRGVWTNYDYWAAFLVFELIASALGLVIALGWMADPNALSIHLFYKSRLVRAYLGASNEVRGHGSRSITEAADKDDVRLADLRNCDRGGPYHLVNTTLNLVGGRDLTTAQRHSSYFVMSRDYCGSLRTGYRETARYMGGRMSLGTAVAISGAAASPAMGSRTPTAAVAMLMTLMNVRTGYWAPTPNRSQWQAGQPRLWPFYTLRELLSQTNDVGSYCYLTDGGHFDNTALYSLVQRGCENILLVDCGADPEPCFADMGDAIRRCRIDFGTEIDLNIDPLLRQSKLPRQHLIVGTIRYSKEHLTSLGRDADNDQGIIIWFKPTLTGDEPADVRQYAIENRVFPQQTTADQWFDEAQFESYRELGEHSASEALGELDAVKTLVEDEQKTAPSPEDIAAIFQQALSTHRPRNPATDQRPPTVQ